MGGGGGDRWPPKKVIEGPGSDAGGPAVRGMSPWRTYVCHATRFEDVAEYDIPPVDAVRASPAVALSPPPVTTAVLCSALFYAGS